MTGVRNEIDADAIFSAAMRTARVRGAVMSKGTRMAAHARREINRAGVDATVQVREHPLSTGRASVDVVVNVADDKDRRRAGRIIRRAGRGAR